MSKVKAAVPKTKFDYLQDKTVWVKVLAKYKSPIIQDEEGGSEAYMLEGTSYSIPAPAIPAKEGGNGSFVDIFTRWFIDQGEDGAFEKGRQMQAELEQLLGYAEGDLDPRIRPGQDVNRHVFKTPGYRITLKKTRSDMESAKISLNLSNPQDFIKYLFCRYSPLCAPSWEERNDKRSYGAAIYDEQTAKVNQFDIDETKGRVMSNLYALKTGATANKSRLYAVYALFIAENKSYRPSVHVGFNSDIKAIYSELVNALTEDKKSKNLKLLDRILSKTPDELNNYSLYQYALVTGDIRKEGDVFKDAENNIIGPSPAEAIKWLNAAKQSKVKLALIARMDADS